MTWTRSATLGLAALAMGLTACGTTTTSMQAGEALYRKGEYLAAVNAFTDAIKRDPRSADAWSNRAMARVRAGQVSAAIADYGRAIELASYDAELFYNRGNALVVAGRHRDAVADYTRAIEIVPGYAKAVFNRGIAYSGLGQHDAARADWARAIELEPDPGTKIAMRRGAGLDGPPAAAAGVKPEAPPGAMPPPVVARPPVVTPAPAPAAAPPPPAVASPPPAPPAPQPAASPQVLDARALVSRALTRELAGDHAGAMQDLGAALGLEPDAARRASIANLMKLLDAPK